MIEEGKYIQARKSQLHFFKNVQLYTKADSNKFLLYKPSGITLGEMRIREGRHPDILYIKQTDKIRGIQEAQKAFNNQLEVAVQSEDSEKVKETLVTIVEETLMEPRSGSLEGVSSTVNILIDDYSRSTDIIQQLIDMSSADYSTVLHSINVMALTLVFAFYNNYSKTECKTLGLSALLHDVGKTKIKNEILTAQRELTNEEFDEIKNHTKAGYNILRTCKFEEREVSLCALEHHETLDGCGYPSSKRNVSKIAQIIGLIDCYEALTNDDRPYRNAMTAFDALNGVIKTNVKDGKFNKEIYTQFVKSLGTIMG